jgi:hypothetical protein
MGAPSDRPAEPERSGPNHSKTRRQDRTMESGWEGLAGILQAFQNHQVLEWGKYTTADSVRPSDLAVFWAVSCARPLAKLVAVSTRHVAAGVSHPLLHCFARRFKNRLPWAQNR